MTAKNHVFSIDEMMGAIIFSFKILTAREMYGCEGMFDQREPRCRPHFLDDSNDNRKHVMRHDSV